MKKVLSMMVFLIVMAAMLFVGCKADTASSSNIVKLDAPNDPWLFPYSKPVTITVALRANTAWTYELPDDDEFKNSVTRYYRDYLNIDLKTEWVSADYNTSLNLAIASGDLPDAFIVNDKQFVQLMEAGLIEDITDAVNNNLSARLKSYFDAAPDVVDVYRRNDRLYGIPQFYYGNEEIPNYLWFRKDWLAQLGFSGDPQSVKELENILEDMNKRYGAQGLAIDKGLGGLLNLSAMYHAAPGIWVTNSDGTIGYGSVQPEMKIALAAFADWYKRGLINPNFSTESGDIVKTDLINGKYGAQVFQQWWGWWAGDGVVGNNGPGTYFEPYLLPSIDSKPVMYPIYYPNYGTTVVRKGYKNADAVVKACNFNVFIDAERKKFGDSMTAPARIALLGLGQDYPFCVRPVTYTALAYKTVQEYKRTGDEGVFLRNLGADFDNRIPRAIAFLEEGKIAPDAAGYALQQWNDRSGYGLGVGIAERNQILKDKVWGVQPDEIGKYGSTLNDLLLEGFTKIILGTEPVAYFDTLVGNWYAQGGQEMTDGVNRIYGKK